MPVVTKTSVPKLIALLYLAELSVLLVVVRVRLSRQGFQHAVNWSTTLRHERAPGEARQQRTVVLARRMAEHVFRWHPVANKCLEQSLLLCRFLSRRGIKPELILAVKKYPFEAHAWARWGDVDLTDPPQSHPEHYRVISRF